MKKLFGLLAVFLLFLIAIFAVMAVFPPTGLAQRLLVAGTRTATGLDLKITGPVTLKLFPHAAMRMENVALTPPAGSARGPGAAPLVTTRVLEVNASLLAAITGGRTIDRVALTGSTVEVSIGMDGLPEGVVTASSRRSPAGGAVGQYSIASLELIDATIDYRDQRSGLAARLERANATVRDARLDGFGEALVKAGAAVVRGPTVGGAIDVADLDAKLSVFDGARIQQAQAVGQTVRWQDAQSKATLVATGVSATGRGVAPALADAVSATAATATWRSGAGAVLETNGFTGSATAVNGNGAGASKLNAGKLSWSDGSGETIETLTLAAELAAVRLDGLGGVTVKAAGATWRTRDGKILSASDLDAIAKSVKPGRAEEFTARSARASYADSKRSGGGGIALEQASFSTPVLAGGVPVEGTLGFTWLKEKIEGRIKLPAPDALLTSTSLPTTVAFTNSRGSLDFEGAIDAATGNAKGRTRAVTSSIEQAAAWLGVGVPANIKGGVTVTGDIDAGSNRVALGNGRIEHGKNAVTGSVAVEFGGPRPRFSGRLAADALAIDGYLGLEAVRPKPLPKPAGGAGAKPQTIEPEVDLSDVFKSTMRAMLDAPLKRDGKIEIPDLSANDLIPAARRAKPVTSAATAWSETTFDVSGLNGFDLDIDWSVKQLDVRGMQLNVPQLKTVLNAGTLALEGTNLGTKDGKISGRAEINARERVPQIEARLKGEGVDLYALSAALGMTPVIDGDTSVEADIKTRGTTQKQLVEGLSGTVKTNMPQGHVLGYDLGNITITTLLRWLTGNREYDPERRTPISGLKADLTIDKGVVKDSQVVMGGPLLGVTAEGTVGLIDQRIDYRGKARIASWFSGLPFKIFGDLSRPTFQPDLNLASVFSRSPAGEPTLSEIIAAAEIKEDAELALLIGRVLQKAGADGLDPATTAALNALQGRALGRR